MQIPNIPVDRSDSPGTMMQESLSKSPEEDAGVEVQVCLQAPGSALHNSKGDEEPPETFHRSDEEARSQAAAAASPSTAARWLWVLFALGWLCPPCWWAAAVAGRARFRQGKCKWAPSNSLTSSQLTAWRACCAMCCISSCVIILACAIHFTRRPQAQEPAPELPVWYYYRVAGPQHILQPLSTQTAALSIAEAIHSTLKLPVDYNFSSIQLLQIAGPAQHRFLLQERGANATGSALPTELTWAFSFEASPALPEPAVLQARALSVDTAPNIIFFLGLQGVLDFTAASQVTGAMTAAHTTNPAADAPKSSQPQQGPAATTGTNFDPSEVLRYPPLPLPDQACTCRLHLNKSRIPMTCPQPWSTPAGNSSVPPALTVRNGTLVERDTGRPAQLRGTNFFGWNTGTLNFDGLWAWQDDDIPKAESVNETGRTDVLHIDWLGKRRMTNDFAAVVHRMKLLGFNAVRVQFTFLELSRNVTTGEEFYQCLLDSYQHIGARTLDPKLLEWLQTPSASLNATANVAVNTTSGPNESVIVSTSAAASMNNTLALNATDNSANNSMELQEQVMADLPPYTGMPHPPPPSGNPECDNMQWSHPFVPGYTGPGAAEGNGSLHLTMCNYYLPQGAGVSAVHRFLWQISYFVSQGFYVLLDFQSARYDEPNLTEPSLLAENWRNLWRMVTELPGYKENLSGRVMPDLVNEPSRWSCQWDNSCQSPWAKTRKCAPILQSFGLASSAIWEVDNSVPIILNGLGQNSGKEKCGGGTYKSMSWGDGFVTNREVVQELNMTDPSTLLTTVASKLPGPGFVLAPHMYPTSITRNPKETAEESGRRWDLSWGLKMQGLDTTSQGLPLPRIPVIIGEFGAHDYGDGSKANKDTTSFTADDQVWLANLAAYLRNLTAKAGVPLSWLFWAWNANSGDTQGIVGPITTWREVQWTKVRLLMREYDLMPWYCKAYPGFCATVEWRQ